MAVLYDPKVASEDARDGKRLPSFNKTHLEHSLRAFMRSRELRHQLPATSKPKQITQGDCVVFLDGHRGATSASMLATLAMLNGTGQACIVDARYAAASTILLTHYIRT